MKQGTKYWAGGLAGRYLLDALLGTVRFHVTAPDAYRELMRSGQPVIYTLWHGRLLPLTYLHRHQGITTMVSRSGDGEYITRIVERWGYHTARGSSSRGGSTALRELVRAGRTGGSVAVTPDGPRGPRQQLKPGVLSAAQLSGMPIMPMTGAATRAWWLEAWDRFLIPKPFSTMYVRYGAPVYVPRAAGQADLRAIGAQLQRTLNELTEAVDADARR